MLDEALLEALQTAVSALPKPMRAKAKIRSYLASFALLSSRYQKSGAALGRLTATTPKAVAGEVQISADKSIAQKRRAYAKLQSASLELVVSQPGVFLGISKGQITVKEKGEVISKIPSANLRFVSILSQGVTISSNLIVFCSDADIPLVLFDSKGKPAAKLSDPDTPDLALWQAQATALADKKGIALATTIVKGKIRNQMNLVKHWAKYRDRNIVPEDESHSQAQDNPPALPQNLERPSFLRQAIDAMDSILETVDAMEGEDLNVLRLSLFQKEAEAAKWYWGAVEDLIGERTGFNGRERQGADDLVNMLFNYGYGILYSRIWDATLRARLNPAISYLHVPQRGKPTLTYDLIEEFRQRAVDNVVVALINRREPMLAENGILTEATRKKLAAAVLERLNTEETFRGTKMRLADIIRYQAQAVAKFLSGESKSYKPYALKW